MRGRALTASWRGRRLELKLIVWFALALLLSLSVAFYFVKVVADRLVRETARQAASGYASQVIGWRHIQAYSPDNDPTAGYVLEQLRELMLNRGYEFEFRRLPDTPTYWDLGGELPSSPEEEQILRQLLERQLATSSATDSSSEASGASEAAPATPTKGLTLVAPGESDVMQEIGPIDDWLYYYYPIRFGRDCLHCHYPEAIELASHGAVSGEPADQRLAAAPPFLTLLIRLPYDGTRGWSLWTFSYMLAIAILTLVATLAIVHWILRRMVIAPLRHLQRVSDEISRGDTDRRADIATDDEFQELGDAFNRMLRHLTDAQQELIEVNQELDRRVDQLAQANLQMFESNRLKSDFLTNMSHELRTPMNSILGFTDLLRQQADLSDRHQGYLANIQRSGHGLLVLIEDVLNLAKMEAGKMQVKSTRFNLQPVVAQQVEVYRQMAQERNIDIQFDPQEPTIEIEQDQSKIEQILINLLSNAIKFTPEGGLITVSSGFLTPERVHFTVEDTGIGIAEEELEVIFEKFRQASAVMTGDGLTREVSGTGLGLSIVRELCKLLGGEVRLCSELGKGSTFRVIVPSRYQPPADQDEPSAATLAAPPQVLYA